MFMEKIKNIANKFALKGEIISVEPYGSGHVNKTYLVETTMGKYVLQKINTVAFKHPEQLMENLLKVATVLSKANKETMNFLPTKDGEIYYHDQDVYRLYEFVDNVVVFQEIPNQQVFEQAGSAFGEFINGLKDFNALELHETIKDFHNTPKRFENFKNAVEYDLVGRAKTCQQEIEFILQREDTLSLAVEELKKGNLPIRVTHNDTKLNNVLMDSKTLKPRMVIDLDTVMAGTLIYDFGDAIRFGASTAKEDEKDLDKVHFDMSMFTAFAKGFLSALDGVITDREKQLLPYGAYLMTIECGMRFLTDYLEGDVYFSTARPEHNLDRARTQLKLAKEMQENLSKMQEIVFKQ